MSEQDPIVAVWVTVNGKANPVRLEVFASYLGILSMDPDVLGWQRECGECGRPKEADRMQPRQGGLVCSSCVGEHDQAYERMAMNAAYLKSL